MKLAWGTPQSWAQVATSDVVALLNDHAHLERKAATNALDLITNWPEPDPPRRWSAVLAEVAREETAHLARVVRALEARGGRMSRSHRNPYARGLRERVRPGGGPAALVDRLLVSALIEARSLERFKLLAAWDFDLAPLYRSLMASERGHAASFVSLARDVPGGGDVASRLAELSDAEATIVRAQPAGPGIHSGI